MVWVDGHSGTTRGDIEYLAEMPPEYRATPVCSVYIDTPLAQVLESLASRTDRMQHADNLVHTTIDGFDLVIGIQVRNTTTTVLHICTSTVGRDAADLRRIILWAQRFRDETNTHAVVVS